MPKKEVTYSINDAPARKLLKIAHFVKLNPAERGPASACESRFANMY